MAGRRAGSHLCLALVTKLWKALWLWERVGSSEHCLSPHQREAGKPFAACPLGRQLLFHSGSRHGTPGDVPTIGVRFFTCSSAWCHLASSLLFRIVGQVPCAQVLVGDRFVGAAVSVYYALFIQQPSWQ